MKKSVKWFDKESDQEDWYIPQVSLHVFKNYNLSCQSR